MGGWEAVVSESSPPPFPSLFDPLLFSSPLATTPGSDANLPSTPSFPPSFRFHFGSRFASFSHFCDVSFGVIHPLWQAGGRAGGGEFWELGKFNKILMIALSRSPSLLPPSFEASPASPTSSKGRRK